MAELYHIKKKKDNRDDDNPLSKISKIASQTGSMAKSGAEQAKNYANFKKPKGKSPISPVGNILTNTSSNIKSSAKKAKAAKISNDYGIPNKNKDEEPSTNVGSGIEKIVGTAGEIINQPKALRKRLNHYQLKNIVAPKHYGR